MDNPADVPAQVSPEDNPADSLEDVPAQVSPASREDVPARRILHRKDASAEPWYSLLRDAPWSPDPDSVRAPVLLR